MIGMIAGWLLSKLMGVASSGIIDKAMDLFGKTKDGEDRTKVEAMRAYVEMTKADVEFNKTKLQMPWFGIMVAVFVLPFGLWWSMIFLDSIFQFPTDVLALPPKIEEWAGNIMQWMFYIGTPVVAIKALLK